MPDFKENIITQILKYWPVKYLIVALLALLVWSGVYHFYRCHLGLNSKFFWSECLECRVVIIDSITKHDTIIKTIIKHDTILTGLRKNNGLSQKGAKHRAIVIMPEMPNIQKIDSGGSGIQNNAPNYAPQAGRDMYLTAEKKLTPGELNVVMQEINRLSKESNIKCVGYDMAMGNNGGEVLYQIKKAVAEAGYDPNNSFIGSAIQNFEGLKIGITMNCITVTIGHFQ